MANADASRNARSGSRSGSRSGAVDNSAKTTKIVNEAKRAERPMAAAAAIPAYSQSAASVQPGSLAANLSLRARNICEAGASLADVLARVGMLAPEPALAQEEFSTENVLHVLDNRVDLEVRSVQALLHSTIHGTNDKEDAGDDDQEEVRGPIAETSYGRSVFYASDIAAGRLRNIDNMLERLRTSLLGERPTADMKAAANDSTGSIHQCISILIERMETTTGRINELTSEIRGTILGE